jgi:hypothetical protein
MSPISGAHSVLRLINGFAPTSGTASINLIQLNWIINQTGGANGITRGLYVNPTLTSAFDFRAIETTVGNVLFNGGNVGIGTSSPLATLDVRRTGALEANFIGTINASINFGVGLGAGQYGYLRFASSLTSLGHSSSASVLSLTSNGNVLINTTTDAGFKLDVNGTARFIGNTQIFGVNRTQGSIVVGTSISNNSGAVGMDSFGTSSSARIFMCDSTGGTNAIINSGGFTYFTVGTLGLGTSTDIASAQLHLTSTTKGFLPPRMTTTQKNAIASPATGLMVYDTTLNVISFYNGTMWV